MGLNVGSSELVPCMAGMPSITYSGSLLALIEFVPRMCTLAPEPGIPLFTSTSTPAALPWRAFERAVVGAALTRRSSPLTDATAPVTSRFWTVA